MNIKFQTTGVSYQPQLSITERKAPSFKEVSSDRDKVTISKNRTAADDSSFARILARQSVKDINKEIDTDKVFRLQQAVSSGAYQPDAGRIAEKLLGY